MKKYKYILLILLLMPFNVLAHPGRTDKNGCHTCRTNCAKWGLRNGQYHCHGGGNSSTTNKKSNTAKKKTTTKKKVVVPVVLSSDATLKYLIINKVEQKIEDTINYDTNIDNIVLQPVAKESKATIKYEKNILLKGDYVTKIIVTAPDKKTTKEYTININRLSDNTGVKVFVNDKEVVFNNYNSDIVNLSLFTKEIDIKYELEDKHATSNIEYDKELDTNDKTIPLEVTSESGKKQIYNINIHRYSLNIDNFNRLLSYIISLIFR